jgi:hypothetical protein
MDFGGISGSLSVMMHAPFFSHQRLSSGRRYRLRTGDRLELGSLKLVVSDMGIVPRGRTAHSTITMNRKAGE